MNDEKQHKELKSDQNSCPPKDEQLAQHFILWKQGQRNKLQNRQYTLFKWGRLYAKYTNDHAMTSPFWWYIFMGCITSTMSGCTSAQSSSLI